MTALETKRQNQVLAYVLERAPVAKTAEIYYFSFEPDPKRRYYVAAAPVVDTDPGLTLVFTLASHSKLIFLTITDAQPRKIAALLSEAEDFDSTGTSMRFSETLRVENEFAAQNGRVAMLLLPASVSRYLPDFPMQTQFDGDTCGLALVVFLSEEEYRTKLERGYDALLDRFESEDRDLVSFGSRS